MMITSKVLAISEVPITIAAAMERRLLISKVPFLQSTREEGVSLFLFRPLCVMLPKTQVNHHPKD